MTSILDYAPIAGQDVIKHLWQLAQPLKGLRVVHVNSTRVGGGVAEILDKLVPLKRELGIDARWEVIQGSERFYECTKGFHNGLQGKEIAMRESLLKVYEETAAANAEEMRAVLADADIVFIHDPQPLPLLRCCGGAQGKMDLALSH
jgi:trehalose synthase